MSAATPQTTAPDEHGFVYDEHGNVDGRVPHHDQTTEAQVRILAWRLCAARDAPPGFDARPCADPSGCDWCMPKARWYLEHPDVERPDV